MKAISAFHDLLVAGGRRCLAASFGSAQSEAVALGRERIAQDFRDLRLISLDEQGPLPKVNEAGEYRTGAFDENVERFRPSSFGRIFRSWTWLARAKTTSPRISAAFHLG